MSFCNPLSHPPEEAIYSPLFSFSGYGRSARLKLVRSAMCFLFLISCGLYSTVRAGDNTTLLCSAASSVIEARRFLNADTSSHLPGTIDAKTSFQSILLVVHDGWSNHPPPDSSDWTDQLKDCRTLTCLKTLLNKQTGLYMRCTRATFSGYENLRGWLHRQQLYTGHHSLIYLDERLRLLRFDEQNTLVFSHFGRRDAAKGVQSLGLDTCSRNLWLGDTQQPGILAIVPYNGLEQFALTGQGPLPQAVPVTLPVIPAPAHLHVQLNTPVHQETPQGQGQNSSVPDYLAPVVGHTLNGMFAGFLGHMVTRPTQHRNLLIRLLFNRSLTTHVIAGGVLFGTTGYMIWNGLNSLDKQVPEWGAITMAGWRLSTSTLYSLANILANQAYSQGEQFLNTSFTNKNKITDSYLQKKNIRTLTDKPVMPTAH